jgi:hypothetical protein
VIVGIAITALLGSVLFIGSQMPSPTDSNPANARTAAGLASGPVVFVPPFGNECRQRMIDNATWQMRDYGMVDCDAALSLNAAGAVPREWAPSRVDSIRNGFRRQ